MLLGRGHRHRSGSKPPHGKPPPVLAAEGWLPALTHSLIHNSRCWEVWSRVLTCSRSRTVSAKPTVCMAMATALAKAKMSPMEPPSSGPRLLEMRK